MPACNLRRLVVLVATASVCQMHIRGADDPPSPPNVATLIEQLENPVLDVRVAAEKQLRERGVDVLAELPDPRTLDAAAADAVRRLQTHLQRLQSRAALAPSRVTLRGRHSLMEVLQAMEQQTANAVVFADLPPAVQQRQLQINFDNIPFWQAVRAVEVQANVVAMRDDQQDAVRITTRDDTQSPPLATTSLGPFRIAVVAAGEQLDFVMPERRLHRTVFDVQVEPRLRPLFLYVDDDEIDVTDAAAGDEAAGPLAALSPSARRELPIDRPGPIRITHDVILPQGNLAPPLRAIDIRGRVEVELAAGRERFVFDQLDEATPMSRRHGGVSVTLEDFEQTDADVRAELQLRYDVDGPQFESHRSWVFHNEVSLTTSSGQSLQPVEYETLHESDGGVRLRYRFADAGPVTTGAQLEYTAPTLFTRVPIDFSLEDVPANR